MGAPAIIGAVVGGATFAAGSTLFGATLVSSALMGAALGSMFDQHNADAGTHSPTYSFGDLQNTASRHVPVPIIYGRVKVAGNVIYHRATNNAKSITMAVGIGEGPIEEIEQIYVNDIPIEKVKGAHWSVLLGTDDQQFDRTPASLTTNFINSNANLTFTAKEPGIEGNDISIQYRNYGPDQPLAVDVQGKEILVTLETGPQEEDPDDPNIVWWDEYSTANDVMAAINQHNEASQLVEVALAPGSNGTALVTSTGRMYLKGGQGTTPDTGERWKYTAVILARFEANEQVSGVPTITAVIKGRKVQVWDEEEEKWETAFSQNPVYCLLDFLRNTRYGVGIPDDRIDFDSFIEEAAYCDELVDGPDGQEARFRIDYVIDYQRPSLDVIDDILATFRAYLLYSDGKVRLQIERSRSPIYEFTMDNIVADSFIYSKASYKDIPNQLRVEWIDPETGWERVEAVYDNEIDQDKRGEVYSRTISLLGVTRPGQAGRMARFYHDSAFWANTFCEFRVGIDALHVEVGDVIQVSHDVPGWDKKLFRVLEIAEEETDEATLRCREYVPAIYHDRGSVYQPGKQTTLPNPLAPPPHVEDVAATEVIRIQPDGTVMPVIRVTWTEPDDVYYFRSRVYMREDPGDPWVFVGASELPTLDIPITEPGTYYILAQSENRSRVRASMDTAPTTSIEAIARDTIPPEAPSTADWSVARVPGGIEVRWEKPAEADWDFTEVYLSRTSGFNPTGWDGDEWTGDPNSPTDFDGNTKNRIATSRGQSIQITDSITPRTTWYVKIVHVDTSGNRSTGNVEEKSITVGGTKGVVVVAASDAGDYWKTVADYVCDGEDDHVEINAALASGGRVELSEGTFVTSASIEMPEYASLVGQGDTTTIESAPNISGNISMIKLIDSGYQTIESLVLNGKLEMQRAIEGERTVASITGVTITSVQILDFSLDGIYLAYDLNVEVSRCFVTGCRDGIAVFLSGGDATISNNRCIGNTRYGIHFGVNSDTDISASISGNHCHQNAIGIRIASVASSFVLSSNHCHDNTGSGISVDNAWGVDGGLVEQNACLRNGVVGISLFGLENMTCSGNEASENGLFGIQIFNLHQSVILGNIARANGHEPPGPGGNTAGILVTNFSSANNIQGNTIRMGDAQPPPNYGIYIDSTSSDNIITNNDLLDSGAITSIDDNGSNNVLVPGNRG